MSATTVPILPVEKGTLVKLWAGVAAVVLIAGGLAWAGTRPATQGGCSMKTASGLGWSVSKAGNGISPTDDDYVLVNYKGSLLDGKEFDSGQRTPFGVTQVVPGFSEGLKLMKKGGSYRLCIPPALGYGKTEQGPIPADSFLIFDVDLIDFKSAAAVQAEMQMMQQMQQMPGGGAPGGAPHGGIPGQ
jgi:FKBP-type peptidyl-prolyl cis-trans isomerase FkpA